MKNKENTDMRQAGAREPNRLAGEKSPYLLQHAHNPVDWRPWGAEAFEFASREDRPVFLSIGYSTCHWCHVMERESFENEEVAQILNRFFVPVKVDREERPDIDRVYMDICVAMTGSGGWPLTVIMEPGGKPFFTGTYFPADDSLGMAGLKNILRQVVRMWRDDRPRLLSSADEIGRAMARPVNYVPGELSAAIMDKAFNQLNYLFDPVYGGIGQSGPKFPQAHQYSFLLRYWKRAGNERALEIAETSLSRIIRGGIYDHAGGGAHRYSTDRYWFAPHFEKMLYDQALLSRALLDAGQATGKQLYMDAARGIIEYVLRDLTSPDGAFFSAEDADSEGVEGKFYLWTKDEIESLLGVRDAELFCEIYGVAPDGNYEGGGNILAEQFSAAAVAEKHFIDERELFERKAEWLEKLRAARARRVRPFLDDKIIASWNGLMISALSQAAIVLDEPRYATAAASAADFILSRMRLPGASLMRRMRDGEIAIEGFLDDYAFMAYGLAGLYEATFETRYLEEAAALAGTMLRKFGSSGGALEYCAGGGVAGFNAQDSQDGAEPGGNSIAALALLRLGRMLDSDEFKNAAGKILAAYSERMAKAPVAYTQMLIAVAEVFGPQEDIKIFRGRDAGTADELLLEARKGYEPDRLVVQASEDGTGNESRAIVCAGYACRPAAHSAAELREILQDCVTKS